MRRSRRSRWATRPEARRITHPKLSSPAMPEPRINALRINSARLWDSMMTMGKIGATPGGGSRRLALSDEDKAGRDLFCRWMREAGCEVTVNQIGNIFCRRKGRNDSLPPRDGRQPPRYGAHRRQIRRGCGGHGGRRADPDAERRGARHRGAGGARGVDERGRLARARPAACYFEVHNEREYSTPEDLAAATNVLLHAVLSKAGTARAAR